MATYKAPGRIINARAAKHGDPRRHLLFDSNHWIFNVFNLSCDASKTPDHDVVAPSAHGMEDEK